MKKHTEKALKRPRGRPREPVNTELVAALIERQDVQAHRTARRIRDVEAANLPADLVAFECARIASSIRQQFERFPDELLALLPAAAQRIRPILVEEIRHALAVLGEELGAPTDAEYEAANRALAADPVLRRPRVTRSATLAAARAQSARLHSQLIALKERIVPVPPGWPLRMEQ